MSEEILYCPKCKRRETFAANVCMVCGREVEDLPATRQKTINDCFLEFLAVSNGLDGEINGKKA